MEFIGLSFCIPTYNRAQSVYRLVTDILSCTDPDIEVVVLDNGSTDDTVNVLQKITDSRLSVFSNGVNRGALYNMVHVLNKGRGEYIVYSTDQDYVDRTKITAFKSFLLRQSGLACGFCTFDGPSSIEYELFPKGFQALKNIAYKGRHPTGYFFNNRLLQSVNIVERFSDYDFVDLFPLEFVFAELSLMGDGAIYHRPIFTPETGSNVVKHKSSTTNGKSKLAFFSPEARLKMAVNYSKHIDSLDIGTLEKSLLIIDAFLNGIDAATVTYKTILGNKALCVHYFMEPRDIKTAELFTIGYNFYKSFVNRTAELWIEEYNMLCLFKIIIFIRLLGKIMLRSAKLVLRAPSKLLAAR